MATPDNISTESSENYLSRLNCGDDFRIYYTDCIRTSVTSNGVWETHKQVSCEIILPEKGKYSCELDGRKISLKPWDMLIVQPGQKHKDILYKGCLFYGFHFHLIPEAGMKLPPSVFRIRVDPRQQVIRLENRDFYLFLIRNLLERSNDRRKEMGYFRLHNALFEVFFRKVLLLYPEDILHETIFRQISRDMDREKLYSAFSRHLAEMPDLQVFCRECGMSRSSLHRLCMKLFGMPPRKAFIRYKILQAQDYILKNPGIRVKEAGAAFGFKNPFHFSRIFRRETGSYPKKFTKTGNS